MTDKSNLWFLRQIFINKWEIFTKILSKCAIIGSNDPPEVIEYDRCTKLVWVDFLEEKPHWVQ